MVAVVAVQRFECTNCGGLDLQFWLTIVALVIAGVALYIALSEHREFLRRLMARADFDLKLRPLPEADDDGIVRVGGSHMTVRLEIGIKNKGDRAASTTLINVIGPRELSGYAWCGPNGEQIEDTNKPTNNTDEVLTDAEGRAHEGKYLALELPRVSRKSHYVKYVQWSAEVPASGERSFPLRVTVQADELPDDVEDISERIMIRIAHN